MLNRVVLIGRTVREPELRYTASGVPVAKMTIAVDRPTGKDREKETDFIDIVTWRGLAENCAKYLDKGRLVAVVGRLQIRSYEAQDGIKRKAAEIVADDVRFLERKGEKSESKPDAGDFGQEIQFNDDDLPF